MTDHPSTIVVVGASQGLGAAVVSSLATFGGGAPVPGHVVHVVAASRNGDLVERVCRDASEAAAAAGNAARRTFAPVVMDATREEDCVRVMAHAAAKKAGGLRAVVYCAGVNHDAAIAEWTSCEEFRSVIAVNLVGAAHVAWAAVPHLAETSGTLVAVTSMAGVLGCVPGGSAYAASKAGEDAFFASIAPELKVMGIRTLIVEPGSFFAEDGSTRQVIGIASGRYSAARRARKGVPAAVVADRIVSAIFREKQGRIWSKTRLVPWLGLSLKTLLPTVFEWFALRARPGLSGPASSSSLSRASQRRMPPRDAKNDDAVNEEEPIITTSLQST